MADFDRVRRLQAELSKLGGEEIDPAPRGMTVDPAVLEAAAEVLAAGIYNTDVAFVTVKFNFDDPGEAAVYALLDEIGVNDLLPGVRAAAYRLAAREAARRG